MLVSPDGSLLACIVEKDIVIYRFHYDLEEKEIIPVKTITPQANLPYLWFSPRNMFLMGWSRPERGSEHSDPPDNVFIYNLNHSEPLIHYSMFQKRSNQPFIWSDDGFIAAKIVTNNVQFFNGTNLTEGMRESLKLEGVQSIFFAPVPKDAQRERRFYRFIVLRVGKKGNGSNAVMYEYPSMEVLASKTFFGLESIKVSWNHKSNFALVMAQTDSVDGSYYGSAKLFMLSSKGDSPNIVGNGGESSVAAAEWNPVENEFIAIHGRLASLWDAKTAEPVFEFGNEHWNTVRWSPHGKFIVLGGFANMAGDFRIWDRHSLSEIAKCSAQGARFYEWHPDGLRFITACLSPWRQVDNDVKVFEYSGKLLQKTDYDECYQVEIRQMEFPAPEVSEADIKKLVATRKRQTRVDVKQVYVPPSLRGKVEQPVVKLTESSKPKVLNAQAIGQKPPVKSQSSGQSKKSKQNAQASKIIPQVEVKDDHSRRKIILKKLRQIDEIRAKQNSGSELNADQLNKLASENSLRAELESLR